MIIKFSDNKYLFDAQTKDLLLERDFKYLLDLNYEICEYKEEDMKILSESNSTRLLQYMLKVKFEQTSKMLQEET